MSFQSFPRSRQEQLDWLSRIKGGSYVLSVEHLNDEEIQTLFRIEYLKFLKLEETADDLLL